MNSTSATTQEEHQSKSVATDEIRLQGDALFTDGRFKEAAETYTEAIEASKGTTTRPNPTSQSKNCVSQARKV